MVLEHLEERLLLTNVVIGKFYLLSTVLCLYSKAKYKEKRGWEVSHGCNKAVEGMAKGLTVANIDSKVGSCHRWLKKYVNKQNLNEQKIFTTEME